MDLEALTDEEFVALRNEVAAEQIRRENITRIPNAMAELTGTYLKSEGVEPGQSWRKPSGAYNSYPKHWKVERNGKIWESLVPGNVWEPGTSGWREVPEDGSPPEWIQPTGAHDAYQKLSEVAHNGSTWESTLNSNVWPPGQYGWDEVVKSSPEPEVPPVEDETPSPVEPTPPVPVNPVSDTWVQPTGAHDAYSIGTIVSHNGTRWKSNVNGNSWEPGVYGWTELTAVSMNVSTPPR